MIQFPSEWLYQELVALHGHRCPMSTLGLRLAYALNEEDGESAATHYRYHSADCAADGIRLMIEKFNPGAQFEIVKEGSHRLVGMAADQIVADLTISKAAMDIAWKYRSFCESSPEDRAGYSFWQSRAALLDTTLARLKGGDASHLFTRNSLER